MVEIFGKSDAIQEVIDLEKSLRKIYDLLLGQWRERHNLTLNEELVASSNGFTLEAMDWLRTRIEPRKWAYLSDLRRRKSVRGQTNKQAWLLHYTAVDVFRAIQAASGEGFEL